jgi:hypothetical protein
MNASLIATDVDGLYRADPDTGATPRAYIRKHFWAAQTVTLDGLVFATALAGNAKYAGIGKTAGKVDFG